jgi:hypothetical protein
MPVPTLPRRLPDVNKKWNSPQGKINVPGTPFECKKNQARLLQASLILIKVYLLVKIANRLPARFNFAVAFAAVNGFSLARFERNLSFFTALGTNGGIHLARAGTGSAGFSEPITAAALAAGRTAFGLVGIPL